MLDDIVTEIYRYRLAKMERMLMSCLRFLHDSNINQHEMTMMIQKIISGGQTGVDRAALDVSIKLNIPHGGWCPKGRKAEDGVISAQYNLIETESDDYSERTKANINDSSGTLIVVPSLPLNVNDGTILTIDYVNQVKKPYYILDMMKSHQQEPSVLMWIKKNNITILNIAGPRESQSPGVYFQAYQFLEEFLLKNNIAIKKCPVPRL